MWCLVSLLRVVFFLYFLFFVFLPLFWCCFVVLAEQCKQVIGPCRAYQVYLLPRHPRPCAQINLTKLEALCDGLLLAWYEKLSNRCSLQYVVCTHLCRGCGQMVHCSGGLSENSYVIADGWHCFCLGEYPPRFLLSYITRAAEEGRKRPREGDEVSHVRRKRGQTSGRESGEGKRGGSENTCQPWR